MKPACCSRSRARWRSIPIVDAIEEFRVETNSHSAEYGRSNGGVIMVNQKSGSNNLHGTLFEFFRNEALNARNLFATTGAKPRFRRNQYGFVLGGPIQKNKTFFFVDWQGTRLDTGVVRTSTVPTSAQKRGVFTQPIFDPRTTRQTAHGLRSRSVSGQHHSRDAMFDPATRAVLDRYPAPNVFSGANEATANNYRRVGTDTTAQDQFDLRLDRYFGARHKVFGRYSYLRDDSEPATPLPDGSGTFTATFIGKTLTRADSVVGEHTWNADSDRRSISSASVSPAEASTARRWRPGNPRRKSRRSRIFRSPPSRTCCRPTMSSDFSNWVRRRTATPASPPR